MARVSRACIICTAVVLLLAATYIAVVPLAFSVFSTDRTFKFTGDFATASVECIRSSVTWDALRRSTLVALIAAVVGMLITSSYQSILRRSWIFAIVLLAAYSIDPTTRGRAYRYLFSYVATNSAMDMGEGIVATLIPAAALAAQYCPLFLFLRLIERGKSLSVPPLNKLLTLLFFRVPATFDRWAFEFSFFFLLCIFDLWIVRIVTGAKANYWGPLLLHRAIGSRDLASGSTMVVLGLLLVLGVFILAKSGIRFTAQIWLRLSPLRLAPYGTRWFSTVYNSFGVVLGALSLSLSLWPLLFIFIHVVPLISRRGFRPESFGEPHSIIVTIALTIVCSLIAAFSGMILAIDLVSRKWRRFLHFSSVVLAFAPEAAFVICCALVTATGVLQPGRFLTCLSLLSFLIPISYLCWNAMLSERDREKVNIAGQALLREPLHIGLSLLQEFLFISIGVSLLLMWLVGEDVILVDFASAPGGKPFSALMFSSAQRGVSESESFWAAAAWLARLSTIASVVAPYWFRRYSPKNGRELW